MADFELKRDGLKQLMDFLEVLLQRDVLYLVLSGELPHHQFAIGVNDQSCAGGLRRGFDTRDERGVLRDIIGGFADVAGDSAERASAFVFEDDADPRFPRISPCCAVRKRVNGHRAEE